MEKTPSRKSYRLKDYDYNSNGAYFITICTNGRKSILSTITVGAGVLDRPEIILSSYGEIVDNQIKEMGKTYSHIFADNYVIMPNHIHMILRIEKGRSGTPAPTANSILSSYVSTLKRFTNKKIGENIWQRSFYDHIIRDDCDYMTKYKYIDENPEKWILKEDEYLV